MTVIVDASVAVKWLVREEGSDAAKALLASEILAAPDFLFIECANVLRTKQRRGDLSPQLVQEAFGILADAPIRAIVSRPHVAAAHAIAIELDRSAYDALYLAVAMAERAQMVTADARFARAAQAHPVYASSVSLLT